MTPHPQQHCEHEGWCWHQILGCKPLEDGKPKCVREGCKGDTRPHTPAAPAEQRYAPCPHTGIFTECYNRQAGCKYQKIIATEDTTDVTCSFQPSEPATDETEIVKAITDAFDRGYAVAMADIEDMGKEKEKDCLKRIKAEREKVLDALEEFLNSDDHLSLFKWEVREQIRSLRGGGA